MDRLDSDEFAPYFREGLLYIPAKTIELLEKADLDHDILAIARRGMQLDDDRIAIGIISDSLVHIMDKLGNDSKAFQDLSSESTQFIFSDAQNSLDSKT